MSDSRSATLLVELGCEELPPKTLDRLARGFFNSVCEQLEKNGIEFDRSGSRALASPRRLAFSIGSVKGRQPDRKLQRRGPAVAAAFDEQGNPTPAALGFARSVGVEVSELERLSNEKGEWLYCEILDQGKTLEQLLFPILENALSALPVAKPMRWADHAFSFVRPVHWLVVLHGDEVLQGELMGHRADNLSRGHRIHHPGPIKIPSADGYIDALRKAYVLVDPTERRQIIRESIEQCIEDKDRDTPRITPTLLDEVNNIVEWPVALQCAFEAAFLEVPPEALIASMEDHQKFFPVLDHEGGLQPRFIVVANLESKQIDAVREGFERVIRPRLADAQFFWNQDRKQPLEASLSILENVVFQEKLGSVSDKSERLAEISGKIADFLGEDVASLRRAAQLSKCDLVSQMVGEFPELQGTMGGYYALASGENEGVSMAIKEHYAPRFSGDSLPASQPGRILALADRLDTLVGIFATGLKPTGNKDPFALRRAALGLVRLLTETGIDMDLKPLIETAATALEDQLNVSDETLLEVHDFIVDRARQMFRDKGFDTRLVNAVLSAPLTSLQDLESRLNALSQFMTLRSAESLVSANKRIGNILRKSGEDQIKEIEDDRLELAEERALFDEIIRVSALLEPLYSSREYSQALTLLAEIHPTINQFFEQVMVMDDDPVIRANRLALLGRLKGLFDRVADLSQAA